MFPMNLLAILQTPDTDTEQKSSQAAGQRATNTKGRQVIASVRVSVAWMATVKPHGRVYATLKEAITCRITATKASTTRRNETNNQKKAGGSICKGICRLDGGS